MKSFLKTVASSKRIKSMIPKKIKQFGRNLLPFEEYTKQYWLELDEYRNIEEISTYEPKYNVTLGIIKELTRYHKHYIGACIEMGVPYKIIDISGSDWIEQISASGCDAFLVRPSALLTTLKQMYDERLKIMNDELRLIIYPSYKETWIYESKRRMYYWLASNNVSHPKTWVFYNENDATEFAKKIELPIVYKTDLGTTSSGVIIFKSRNKLLSHLKKCFSSGYVVRGGDPRDKQWGSVFFQEYIQNVREWRIVHIDGSYFGHEKLKVGDFHSGSKSIGWTVPSAKLLSFAKEVVLKGDFNSMCLDIFETSDGTFMVNELQALFGQSTDAQMYLNGKPGRYLYDAIDNEWIFEEGDFCRNACSNLRVLAVINRLINARKN